MTLMGHLHFQAIKFDQTQPLCHDDADYMRTELKFKQYAALQSHWA